MPPPPCKNERSLRTRYTHHLHQPPQSSCQVPHLSGCVQVTAWLSENMGKLLHRSTTLFHVFPSQVAPVSSSRQHTDNNMTDCMNLGTHIVTSSFKPASLNLKTAWSTMFFWVWATLVSLSVCIPESYKDPQESISGVHAISHIWHNGMSSQISTILT